VLETEVVRSVRDQEDARRLLREYRDWLADHSRAAGLPETMIETGSHLLDEEIRTVPGAYGPPSGALVLARSGTELTGCVAIRRIDEGTAEIKRLFVRARIRGKGVGGLLARAALEEARRLGYPRVVLDTMPTMTVAISIYQRLGFAPIPPYWDNPVPGALFFEYRLRSS
jgi:GNAT superfamily N-acetyltransferase